MFSEIDGVVAGLVSKDYYQDEKEYPSNPDSHIGPRSPSNSCIRCQNCHWLLVSTEALVPHFMFFMQCLDFYCSRTPIVAIGGEQVLKETMQVVKAQARRRCWQVVGIRPDGRLHICATHPKKEEIEKLFADMQK